MHAPGPVEVLAGSVLGGNHDVGGDHDFVPGFPCAIHVCRMLSAHAHAGLFPQMVLIANMFAIHHGVVPSHHCPDETVATIQAPDSHIRLDVPIAVATGRPALPIVHYVVHAAMHFATTAVQDHWQQTTLLSSGSTGEILKWYLCVGPGPSSVKLYINVKLYNILLYIYIIVYIRAHSFGLT